MASQCWGTLYRDFTPYFCEAAWKMFNSLNSWFVRGSTFSSCRHLDILWQRNIIMLIKYTAKFSDPKYQSRLCIRGSYLCPPAANGHTHFAIYGNVFVLLLFWKKDLGMLSICFCIRYSWRLYTIILKTECIVLFIFIGGNTPEY